MGLMLIQMLSACSGGGSNGEHQKSGSEPAEIQVIATPSNLVSENEVAKGAVVQLKAIATLQSGAKQDVTSLASWSSNAQDTLTFNTKECASCASALKMGQAKVTASFKGLKGELNLEVVAAKPVSIAITPERLNNGLPVGEQILAEALVQLSDGVIAKAPETIQWSSSDNAVATVESEGSNKAKITAVGIGTASIKASLGETNSNELTLTVFASSSAPELIIEPNVPDTLPLGRIQNFSAKLKYAEGNLIDITQRVIWKTNDEQVAKFPADFQAGQLLASPSNKGQVTVSVKDPLNNLENQVNVRIADIKMTDLSIEPQSELAKALPSGTKLQLSAIASFADNISRDVTKTVQWSIADNDYLSVDNHFEKKGKLSVNRARLSDETKTAVVVEDSISSNSTRVVVDAKFAEVQRIDLSRSTIVLPVGMKEQLQATAVFKDGSTMPITENVFWSSSNGQIASVGSTAPNSGLVHALKEGVTTVQANFAFEGKTYQSPAATITVSPASLQTITIKPEAKIELELGSSKRLIAEGFYSDGTTKDITTSVNWSSSKAKAISVVSSGNHAGTITAHEVADSVLINVYEPSTSVFASKPVTSKLRSKVALEINSSQGFTKPVGIPELLSADLHLVDGKVEPVSEHVVWSSSDTSIAVVSNEPGKKGQVVGLQEGVVQISVSGFDTVSAPVSFSVTAATLQRIEVSPKVTGISVGETLQFQAMGSYSDGDRQDITNQVTWNVDKQALASISNATGTKGNLEAKSSGLVNVSATLGSVNSDIAEVVINNPSGDEALGQVSLSVSMGGNILDKASGFLAESDTESTLTLPIGQAMELIANPLDGYQFTGWVGCLNTNGPVCNLIVDAQSQRVSAQFKKL